MPRGTHAERDAALTHSVLRFVHICLRQARPAEHRQQRAVERARPTEAHRSTLTIFLVSRGFIAGSVWVLRGTQCENVTHPLAHRREPRLAL